METTVETVQTGMGVTILEHGAAFRLWAPHADAVYVIGSFNGWSGDAHPMQREDQGTWFTEVPEASIGDRYKFRIVRGKQTMDRIDPYAREVSNSVGEGVIPDPEFDWGENNFELAPWNELVIYELHLGTFSRPDSGGPAVGTFEDAIAKLDYLKELGINAIELMPVAEFAGDISWGYNPAHIFAVESAYGGPAGLKKFIRAAHQRGIGVILDVVYNHFGPSDLDLWQFDGWSENDKGGIYFYNDWRSSTPWGDTRPDYGRGEVRQYICDNALMWLEDYHIDGLRFDMTLFIRSVDAMLEKPIPEGWSLAQWINREVAERYPSRITIAEDLQNDEYLTKPEELGGAGFGAQWDAGFVHPLRDVLTQVHDEHRCMEKVKGALLHEYNIDVFERVVYTESHDEVANGKQRVPSEINPEDPDGWHAQARSTLGAAMVMTAPGIPMLFQGQEFLRTGWFDDTKPLKWNREKRYRGLVDLYRDLISARRNLNDVTRGLTAQNIEVFHVNNERKIIAFRRFDQGGPGDDTIVVANFANHLWEDYHLGLPAKGRWTLRVNTQWEGYSEAFDDKHTGDVQADGEARDGQASSASFRIPPYVCLIYSQDS